MSVKIDYVIGMPPSNPGSGDQMPTDDVMKESMPIVYVEPGEPEFELGFNVFRRKNTLTKFMKQLSNDYGVQLDETIHGKGIKIAYIADSFPTDTFQNEYGENFLESMTNVVSSGAADLVQMTGATSATKAISQIGAGFKEGGGVINETIGGILGAVGKGAEGVMGGLKKIPYIGNQANTVDKLLAGQRIDMPMVWKGSAFQPSYTMTIRLYNPDPGRVESTSKYIVAPLAALLLLGLPQVDEGSATYRWPYLHRFRSPGIYDIEPAYISSITVVKGGDQQQIAYTQRLGIVDVRIDFSSLYSSLVASKDTSLNRPTLKTYLDTLIETPKDVKSHATDLSGQLQAQEEGFQAAEEKMHQAAPTYTEVDPQQTGVIQQRINTELSTIAVKLSSQIPSGLKSSIL